MTYQRFRLNPVSLQVLKQTVLALEPCCMLEVLEAFDNHRINQSEFIIFVETVLPFLDRIGWQKDYYADYCKILLNIFIESEEWEKIAGINDDIQNNIPIKVQNPQKFIQMEYSKIIMRMRAAHRSCIIKNDTAYLDFIDEYGITDLEKLNRATIAIAATCLLAGAVTSVVPGVGIVAIPLFVTSLFFFLASSIIALINYEKKMFHRNKLTYDQEMLHRNKLIYCKVPLAEQRPFFSIGLKQPAIPENAIQRPNLEPIAHINKTHFRNCSYFIRRIIKSLAGMPKICLTPLMRRGLTFEVHDINKEDAMMKKYPVQIS